MIHVTKLSILQTCFHCLGPKLPNSLYKMRGTFFLKMPLYAAIPSTCLRPARPRSYLDFPEKSINWSFLLIYLLSAVDS